MLQSILYQYIVFFPEDNKTWSLNRKRRLYGRKPFDYAAFNQSGDFIVVAAESDVEFVYDSTKPISEPENTSNNATNNPIGNVYKQNFPMINPDTQALLLKDI